jgi:single-strand DNA-binding protein
MASLNRCFLMGRLTRDPELTYSPKGTPVVALGLAVNRVWTDEEQRKHEETTFIDITLWGRLAEIAQQYLKKGSAAFIEGRLQLDTWEAGGVKKSRLRVIGEHLQLLGRREGAQAAPSADAAPAPRRPAVSPPERSQPAPAGKAFVEPDLGVDPF